MDFGGVKPTNLSLRVSATALGLFLFVAVQHVKKPWSKYVKRKAILLPVSCKHAASFLTVLRRDVYSGAPTLRASMAWCKGAFLQFFLNCVFAPQPRLNPVRARERIVPTVISYIRLSYM